MADAPLLQLNGLGKRFGGLLVIDKLSTTVGPDELLGVVGPNGAGKSTLFNLIAGEIRPDTGSVVFAGQDITSLPAYRRCHAGIGRTYQIPQPFSGMTVFENVLVGAAHGRKAARRLLARGGTPPLRPPAAGHAPRGSESYELGQQALQRVGLFPKANEQAADLGLLDRKRLELARALATGPRLLLLDEVAGGLTEPEVDDLVAVIKQVRAQGVAIIWIEHIVDALISVVDRLMCLTTGRVLMEGDPAAVLASREVQEVYLGTTDPGQLHGADGSASPGGPASSGGRS